MKQLLIVLSLFAFLVCSALPAIAEDKAHRFEAADSEGVIATRAGNILLLDVEEGVKSPIKIPRLAAPLRTIYWEAAVHSGGLQLKPEPDHWVISWKDRPNGAKTIVVKLDAAPLLMSEVKPIKAGADGSFYIPAHLAVTRGDKLRYEPQPNKNTVGFWVNDADFAVWTIALEKPGRFKVAVLQGCGRGQGGSTGSVWFHQWLEEGRVKPDPQVKIDFNVFETGHFQNFQWVHIGEAELTETGNTRIEVSPGEIKKAALMDIRAIHLIRLPDKKY